MTKKIVKNFSNLPIYLNLPGGRSLKIPARGEVEVDEADVASNDMALHISRGNAAVTEADEEGEKAASEGEKEAAAEGKKGGAQEQKPETKAEAGTRPTGGAKDAEGGTE